MKKALSLFLVVLMLVGMLPMVAFNANAAEVSETMTLAGSTGTVSGESISWTSGNLTFAANKNTSSTAIRTQDTDHFRLYVGFSATLTCSAGNITKIVMTATGSSYAIAPTGSDGSVGTVSGTTITIVPSESSNTYTIPSITKQTRIKSITVTYATVDSGDCAHTNTEEIAAVAATCTTAGNTAGVKCTDCGTVLEGIETIDALGHTNDEGVVTAATCTTDGYTLYTCTVCGSTKKDNYVDATGHNYVDGVCSVCSVAMPTGLDGKYYIAAIRSSGNYFYMTNDLGTASTKRYQIVDSGLTELPASIETPVDAQIFELIFDAATATYKIKTGDQYLGWTSGNSGALVDEASAIAATIENSAVEGAYVIHFTESTTTAGVETVRYLSLNSNASNAYYAWYKLGQVSDLYLVPVVTDDSGEEGGDDTTTPETCLPGECVYVDGVCSVCGSKEPEGGVDTPDASTSATIDFSSTAQRVSQDTSSQVWSNGGATLTNNKGSSTSNVADYSNPARFYKSSEVIIAFTGMTKIEFACSSASYATALANSISDDSVAVTVDGTTVTIVPSAAINSYTITLSGGQVRVNSITVYAEVSDCTHEWGEWVETTAPTCTATGVQTSTCALCGETKTQTVAATGHTYTYADGAMTCTCGDSVTINTIAEAKAYTSTSQVYYVKGIVTYVSGKTVYIEDATGAICVYFASAPSDIALGDEIVVWDTMTTYNGLIETTNTTALEYLKVSSGNALPSQTVTMADLLADTTNEYLGERVVIEDVVIGVLGTNNTALTDADGNTINIYKAPTLNEEITENDTVTVTAIVSTYNAYQLLVNSADDVVLVKDGAETVIETVNISEALDGDAGEYFQVEGTVTYISGRNVYIQDATGGIVVYLTANAATVQVGDKVKAYGALKNYNGLLELDAVDETNTQFFEILSSGNSVDAQAVTIADLLSDTENAYHAKKITLSNVYVSYYSYSSSYGNVTYTLLDTATGKTIKINRVTVASEAECYAAGSLVNLEANVSVYKTDSTEGNGYQLVTDNDKITVLSVCTHETTELVNYVAATCTEGGYSGDTQCTVCQYYVARGEDTAALGHSFTNGTCSVCGEADPDYTPVVYSVVFGSTIRNSANFVGAVELNQYSDITFSDNLTQEYILNNGGLLAFDGEVTEENATLENCEKVTYGLKLSNGLYGGTTAGIPAAEYGKELTLRLFVKLPNGEVVYGGLKSYSVKQYCEGRIASASSAQTMKNLAAATLHYGAMAQYNFNKDTGNLANANLPAEYAQSAFAYDASYIDALNTDATFALAGTGTFAAPRRTLNFVGAVEIVHQFQPSGIENMQKIEMLVWKNMSGELNEADADVIAMEDAGDGWYKANTAGIPAAEYGYTFILCAKVTDAEGNTYYSDLSFYSPETYAANQIAKTSSSENTKNVCMAMVVFGQMAKIHFGK